jgi:hypothetical protein
MQSENSLNLSLIYNDKLAQELQLYSQALNKIHPSMTILGNDAYPHISLLQFQSDKDVSDIWHLVKNIKVDPIDHNGIYFDRNTSGSHIWHGIRVQLTDSLSSLQTALFDLVKPNENVTALGYHYFPHTTLGKIDATSILGPLPFLDCATTKNITCRLALGRAGSHMEVKEIIYEQ